jgi:hypothetical protein
MLETLTQALGAAETVGIILAVEPEPANVVSDASCGRRLLDTMGSARLKIILDPANLVNLDAPKGDREGLARPSIFSLLTPSWFMRRIDEPTALCAQPGKLLSSSYLSLVACSGLATTARSWSMGFRRTRCRVQSIICVPCLGNFPESLPMPTIDLNGEVFHYASVGDGPPFVFQHGMGADTTQHLALAATSSAGGPSP